MSKRVLRRRGTTLEHTTFTGFDGEITVDTDKQTAVVHNISGSIANGKPLLLEDMSNIGMGDGGVAVPLIGRDALGLDNAATRHVFEGGDPVLGTDLLERDFFGTAAGLNAGTGAAEVLLITVPGVLPAMSAENLTNFPELGVTAAVVNNNVAQFRSMAGLNTTIQPMVDGMIDSQEDQAGINVGSIVNFVYNVPVYSKIIVGNAATLTTNIFPAVNQPSSCTVTVLTDYTAGDYAVDTIVSVSRDGGVTYISSEASGLTNRGSTEYPATSKHVTLADFVWDAEPAGTNIIIKFEWGIAADIDILGYAINWS